MFAKSDERTLAMRESVVERSEKFEEAFGQVGFGIESRRRGIYRHDARGEIFGIEERGRIEGSAGHCCSVSRLFGQSVARSTLRDCGGIDGTPRI